MLDLTTQIVAAHIGNHQTPTEALPDLIKSVYRSLSRASEGPAEPLQETLTPAVPIKKSVFPDYIVCLEDGKKLKMLRRHLHTSYNMSPTDYRVKWGLPADYPMVAPNYATIRSGLAKAAGLGRKAKIEPLAVEGHEPEVKMAPARRAKGSRG